MSEKKHVFKCPVGSALEYFAGRWKPEILWHLKKEPMRFNQLLRAIGSVSQKMLTQQLRELERDGLVKRTQFAEIPPRVVYEPTQLTRSLTKLFDDISDWGVNNKSEIEKCQKLYDQSH